MRFSLSSRVDQVRWDVRASLSYLAAMLPMIVMASCSRNAPVSEDSGESTAAVSALNPAASSFNDRSYLDVRGSGGKSTADKLRSGGVGPRMVVVEPTHRRRSYRYLMSKSEVTNREYGLFCRQTGRAFTKPDGGDDKPVVGLPVSEMLAYTTWLSLQTGQEYRLPRVVEWRDVPAGAKGRSVHRNPWKVVGYDNDVDEQVYSLSAHSEEAGGREFNVAYIGEYETTNGRTIQTSNYANEYLVGVSAAAILGGLDSVVELMIHEPPDLSLWGTVRVDYAVRLRPTQAMDPSKYYVGLAVIAAYYAPGAENVVGYRNSLPRTDHAEPFGPLFPKDRPGLNREKIGFRVVSPIKPTAEFIARVSWGVSECLYPERFRGERPLLSIQPHQAAQDKTGRRFVYMRNK